MSLYERMSNRYPENFKNCFDFSTGEGWDNIVEELIHSVIKLDPEVSIVQVKEKFGGLRFYIDGTTCDSVYDLIAETEELSEKTCDVCGKTGAIIRSGGWLACRCEEHSHEDRY